jgi:hypothetical protein
MKPNGAIARMLVPFDTLRCYPGAKAFKDDPLFLAQDF